jgi:hypothetical protein
MPIMEMRCKYFIILQKCTPINKKNEYNVAIYLILYKTNSKDSKTN